MMPQSWDKHAIKAEIHRRGTTLTKLAEKYGLGSSSCRVALIAPAPAANRAIADFLGVSLHELWPHWYDEQGNNLRVVRHGSSICHEHKETVVRRQK